MFRIKNKKGSGSDTEQTVVAEPQEPAEQAPVAKVPPRRPLPVVARPLVSPTLSVDIHRRGGEAPGSLMRADPSSARDKSLVIGRDVRLKGEIFACDKVILEGDAEIALTGCRHLQIGAAGSFRGIADVAEADIGGQFEGDLVARERLTVRPTGRIKGTVRYAQMAIESGGQITGEMTMLDAVAQSASGAANVQTNLRAPEPSGRGDVNAYVAPAVGEAVAPANRP
jgi:cytoskeletal protein CcmA (bactofilin family)